MASSSRPLLRRVLSFREPLLLIPYLIGFVAAAASGFFHSYSSFLHSFARSVVPAAAACAVVKCAYSSSSAAESCGEAGVAAAAAQEEEEGEEALRPLSREEVEEIMERIGLGVAGHGEGLRPRIGHDEVSRLFDADEPSFAEVRRAFAVFDGNSDGFIDASDLQLALARLGFREDAAACRAMIAASCGSIDGRMNLFQFVKFLETGLC
ncbi:probable calcium-binding protein CML46 [Oryza brachyantha]|uniref:EF-hand domain-containing protein n=1 Tax=Oryza brachyantha TaxID=4533 RepID=J3MN92_ORYBR|nr:probable calcium-binding protein CML46 [Oryza brachyantha]